MAGAKSGKGTWGGARPNTGGARKGAGRKPKIPKVPEITKQDDPKVFLLELMNDPAADPRMRADAAKALMPYMHPKVAEVGKKDDRAKAAKTAGTGKFAAAAPPLKLVSR